MVGGIFMADRAVSSNVFVWKSCTDQCEIYSLLEVVVCSQRHLQGWLAGGGQGLRVFFFFFFSPLQSCLA